MTHKLSGSQPENARTKVYGSQPVEPMKSGNQPDTLQHTKVHGVKTCATETVVVKESGKDAVINCTAFDPAIHARVE